jgi:hypothetical protein
MAIDLEDIGSRYTTTATASFRRAPLGGLGVVPNYVPSSQIDALDAAWDDLTNGSHSKNNLEIKAPQVGFFQLVNVPKNLNDSFNAIWKAYTSWRDTQVDIVKNTAPGFAAQQTALGQAKSIYAQAVAAGAKPEAVAIAKVSKQTFTPEAVTAGTGAVLVALGLAFVLITWQPRRRSGGAMTGLDGVWSINKHAHVKRGPRYTVYHEPSGLAASKRLTHKQAKELMRALEERFPNFDPSAGQSEIKKVAEFVRELGARPGRFGALPKFKIGDEQSLVKMSRRRSGGAMAGIERTPEQLSKAQKYVRKIRNVNKQEYARAYLAHLTQDTPEPGRGKLGTMGAQAVRHQLKTIFEEEGFRGLSGAKGR